MSEATMTESGNEAVFAHGKIYGGWKTVGTSMLMLAFGPSNLLLLCFGVFAIALNKDLGWPAPSVAIGASIISLMVMVVSPVQGVLVDRFGGRPVLLASIPTFALGLFAMSKLPGDIGYFYAACAILPVLGIGLWPLSYMKLVSSWFDHRLGIAIGMVNVGLSLGAAILPAVLGIVFIHYGWRSAYIGLAVVLVAVVLPVAVIWMRERGPARTVMLAVPGALRDAVRTPSFPIMVATFFILGMLSTGMIVHQLPILIDAGLSPERAILIQSTLGIASIVGRIAAGWLLDRVHAKYVGAAILVGAALGCLILTTPFAVAAPVVPAMIMGLVIGAEFDILAYMIRRYQGVTAFGRIYGLTFSAFQLGAAIGVALIALSKSRLGSYDPALFGLSVLCIAAAILFMRLGSYRFGPGMSADAPPARA